MQITDDDLTEDRARSALHWLDEHLASRGFLFGMGRLNRLKVLEGFMLKQNALNPEAWNQDLVVEQYCTWLRDEGFWYD
jgi:hypothetical protein